MKDKRVSGGTAHTLPKDFESALTPRALSTWEHITPLARNEWICWVISVAKPETRVQHIRRAVEELTKGKRRPCCWMGCTHRSDKPMSASQKYIVRSRARKKA